MSDFNRDRRPGGGRDFKRRDFGGGSDRPQIMHKAICSNCGKECEVPFKPNGSKPVFCRECFQNNRNSDSRPNNYERRPNFEERNNNQSPRPVQQPQYKEQFDSLNAKLDKILNLLAKNEPIKEVAVIEPILAQTPEIEIPIIKKKRVSKK